MQKRRFYVGYAMIRAVTIKCHTKNQLDHTKRITIAMKINTNAGTVEGESYSLNQAAVNSVSKVSCLSL